MSPSKMARRDLKLNKVVVQTERVDIDVDQSLVHIRQPTIAFPMGSAGRELGPV